jgi:hypothetical protein
MCYCAVAHLVHDAVLLGRRNLLASVLHPVQEALRLALAQPAARRRLREPLDRVVRRARRALPAVLGPVHVGLGVPLREAAAPQPRIHPLVRVVRPWPGGAAGADNLPVDEVLGQLLRRHVVVGGRGWHRRGVRLLRKAGDGRLAKSDRRRLHHPIWVGGHGGLHPPGLGFCFKVTFAHRRPRLASPRLAESPRRGARLRSAEGGSAAAALTAAVCSCSDVAALSTTFSGPVSDASVRAVRLRHQRASLASCRIRS